MTSGTIPIKRVADVRYGLGQPLPLVPDGVPIIRATNIERGQIIDRGLVFARLEDLPLDRAPLLLEGEILVVRSGAYTGDSALVTARWAGAAPGYDLRLTPMGVRPRFLAYCLLSTLVQDQIAIARDRAAQPHLNAEDLGEVDVPRWPAGRQDAIAGYLDVETSRIDALIAKKKRVAELLWERRASTLEHLLWTEEAEEIPLKRLLHQSPCYGVLKPDFYEGPGATPLIRILDVTDGSVALENRVTISPAQDEEYRRTRLEVGDVVVSVVGTLGKGFVVDAALSGSNMSRALARLVPRDGVSPEYLALWISSQPFADRCEEICRATAQMVLNMGDLREFLVPVPPNISYTERRAHEIQERILPVDQAGQKIERQLALLVEYRQALITAAVTGEVDIPGAAA